jgi:hypothetical protein
VPQGPDSVLICRYNGLPQPAGKIAGFTLTGAQALGLTQATTLASAFDALQPYVAGKVYSCPLDSGAAETVDAVGERSCSGGFSMICEKRTTVTVSSIETLRP